MTAEIVAVGSELLLGDAVDTNSAWISARLNEIGVDVHRHVTVGDNDARLRGELAAACARADEVIVTGGLGPTQDDRTRYVVADLAGVGLARDDRLVAYLERFFSERGRDMPANNLPQADVPVGASVLEPVGTAAGFALRVDVGGSSGSARLWCLPGVPREMEVMVHRDLVPTLAAGIGAATTVSRLVRTAGMGESHVAERCADLVERLDEAGNPTIAFLATRGETRVRVTGKAATREEALALVDPVVEEVVARVGSGFAGLDDEGTEHAVARLLRVLGWRLATAESVTGGGVSARLVRVPGASDWFRGGVVAYATEAKEALAEVDVALLDEHGPASEEAAGALAVGARQRLGADVALSVVGVAGPTGQSGGDVGEVRLAVVLPAKEDGESGESGEPVVQHRTVRLPGRGREALLDFAASAALDYLRRRLAEAVEVVTGPAEGAPREQ